MLIHSIHETKGDNSMTFLYIVVAVAVCMFFIEFIKAGRKWPKTSNWLARAFALNIIGASTTFLYGTGFREWIESYRMWSIEDMGVIGGALIGYLVLSFINYWWHRLRHKCSFFWLWFHQIHHSPQRIEVLTTFYKHPFEAIANSTVSAPILYLLVGLNAEAAAGALLLAGLIEIFYHWNIKTPYWLGFIIQRPESHCIHHQERLHHYNYADLPIWDMIFGTFRNPKEWNKTCGLGSENETRLAEMLVGIDVLKRKRPQKARKKNFAST